MEQQNSLSVVVTTKNEGKNLPDLFHSLLNQGDDFDLIVVDSESTDNTREVIMDFQGKLNLKFFSKRSSRGAGRNFGVQQSRSEYVLFLDGDVIAAPGLIGSYLSHIKDKPDFVAGNAIARGVERFKLSRVKLFVSGFEITMPSANLCYRRDVFLQLGGFDESFVTAEDIDLNFRAVVAGYRGHLCGECIVFNRTRQSLRSFLKQAFWNGYGRYQLRRKNADRWHLVTKGKPLKEDRSVMNILRLASGSLGYAYALLLRGRFP